MARDERRRLVHRYGAAEALSLDDVAFVRSQKADLLMGFDAFRYDLESQFMAERNTGFGNCRHVVIFQGIRNEGTNKKQDDERKTKQIGQRGIACSKIVD